MLSNTHSYRHTLSCIFSVMPSFYYLIFIHRYLRTHARPACPICWTTLAVRSLAEQSAAVRSKLSCKTNLIWRGLINKWDYVLKKTRLYTLNRIWSCFRNLWMFLLYLIWGLAVFSSLRPSFTVNLTEWGPFRNPYRASLLDTPFSSTSLKCIKHLAPLTLDQLQQMIMRMFHWFHLNIKTNESHFYCRPKL